MYYECKSCKSTRPRGFLSNASGGTVFLSAVSAATVLLLALTEEFFSRHLGRWWFAGALPVALTTGVIATLLAFMSLELADWLYVSILDPCDKCGSRSYKKGHTKGFGL